MTTKAVGRPKREYTPPGRIRGERTGFMPGGEETDKLSPQEVVQTYEVFVGVVWGGDADPTPGEMPQIPAREALARAGLGNLTSDQAGEVLAQLATTKGKSRCLTVPQTLDGLIVGKDIPTKQCYGCLFHDQTDASRPCKLDTTPFDWKEQLQLIRGRNNGKSTGRTQKKRR